MAAFTQLVTTERSAWKGRNGRAWRAILSLVGLVLCPFLLLRPLTTPASFAKAPGEDPLATCEYLSFFASMQSNYYSRSWLPRPERERKVALEHATETLIGLGLRKVNDLSDASWVLRTGQWVAKNGSLMLRISFSAQGKMEHHMFVVLVDDPTFPYRGSLGMGYKLETLPSESPSSIASRVQDAMKAIWATEAEQTLALCDARVKLIREGWAAIEEFRLKMIEEMERIRWERAKTQRGKHLELEVEGVAVP